MDNEQRKAKEIQDEYDRILEEAKQAYDRERVRFNKQILAPTSIGPVDPSVRTEPVEYNPNVVTDPNSWLNKGLGNLAGSVADVVIGQPSGNDIVDMGVANVPYVGAGAILAAGGMPGAVDVVGLPALKNMSKIPKYTYEFVSKYFGPRGLANLDNALTKYPKAGKPSVNDAVTIMREGIGGDVVPAIAPYRSTDIEEDLLSTLRDTPDKETLHRDIDMLVEGADDNIKDFANQIRTKYYQAVDNQDLGKMMMYRGVLDDVYFRPEKIDVAKRAVAQLEQSNTVLNDLFRLKGVNKDVELERLDKLREMKEITESPVQDWDKIIQSQERRDVKNALKEAKKAEKEAMVASEPEPVAIVEEPVDNRPQWQKNGWKSDVRSPEWYSRVGRNMSEDSKRDFYGVDSLARHWAGKIQPQKGFIDANIIGGKARAEARHDLTNYNNVADAFRKDIQRNIESGNIPGTAVQLLQRFKNNKPVEGKTTPTLVLRLNERPRALPDVNVYADEAQGPDLYELLFRPRVDKVLHDANPGYYLLK